MMCNGLAGFYVKIPDLRTGSKGILLERIFLLLKDEYLCLRSKEDCNEDKGCAMCTMSIVIKSISGKEFFSGDSADKKINCLAQAEPRTASRWPYQLVIYHC